MVVWVTRSQGLVGVWKTDIITTNYDGRNGELTKMEVHHSCQNPTQAPNTKVVAVVENERVVEQLGEDGQTEELFVAFAEFEENCKEMERARCIYKYSLGHIAKGQVEYLYRIFFMFEKCY